MEIQQDSKLIQSFFGELAETTLHQIKNSSSAHTSSHHADVVQGLGKLMQIPFQVSKKVAVQTNQQQIIRSYTIKENGHSAISVLLHHRL